jgi:hypothetical protein
MALYRATGDQKYKDYAVAWGKANKWETCHYPDTLQQKDAANDESCGQTYAELFLEDLDYEYINITEQVLAVQVNRTQVDDWWWVDAFFMAMGTFTRIGSWRRETEIDRQGDAENRDGEAGQPHVRARSCLRSSRGVGEARGCPLNVSLSPHPMTCVTCTHGPGNITGDHRFHEKNFALFNDSALRLRAFGDQA